jgi:hypothetical protein
MDDLSNYRLWRFDKRNMVLQEKNSKGVWVTKRYFGNSLKSLILGLFDVIMENHTPSEKKLFNQLASIELELINGIAHIEKMIKEYYSANNDD